MRALRDWRVVRDAALVPVLIVLWVIAIPAALEAQGPCDAANPELRMLRFTGNRAFGSSDLATRIETTPSDWTRRVFGFGTPRCLDRGDLRADMSRLRVFYRDRGYPEAQVDTAISPAIRGSVDLLFRIVEGEPTLIDTFTVTGLDSLTRDQRGEVLRDLGIGAGTVFDRARLQAAADTIRARLWNRGYPRADVAREYTVRSAERRASVGLTVVPGAFARLGDVRVVSIPASGNPQQIPDGVVRRIAGIRASQVYREDDLANAQRRLYQTDAFRSVDVRAAGDSAAGDSLLAVTITVREDLMRQVDAEVGWATLDCFRTRAVYTDRNFLRGARRLELTGQLSKIGFGKPLDFAPALCTGDLQSDDFSADLNYFAGATLRQPNLLGTAFTPQLSLYSERRGEYRAYLRTTIIGGDLSATRQIGRDFPLRLGYTVEYGRTKAQPALLCAVFSRCDELSRERILRNQLLAVGSVALGRVKMDNVVTPTFGFAARGEYRIAHRLLGSAADLQFHRGSGDYSLIRPVPGGVGAIRLRLGAVFPIGGLGTGQGSAFIPPQERLYAGGATSVRGFQQNELGAVGYIADDEPFAAVIGDSTFYFLPDSVLDDRLRRVVPFGGDALVVTNFEYRIPNPLAPRLVQHVLFADAGSVWNRGAGRFALRWTPGTSVRVITPVGPVQINVAYNPYAKPAGPVYYDFPLDDPTVPERLRGQLVCVLPLTGLPADAAAAQQLAASGTCPSLYSPPASRILVRRLTLTFSIGPEF